MRLLLFISVLILGILPVSGQEKPFEIWFNKGAFNEDKKIPYDQPTIIKVPVAYMSNDTTRIDVREITLSIEDAKGHSREYAGERKLNYYAIKVNTEEFYPGAKYKFIFKMKAAPGKSVIASLKEELNALNGLSELRTRTREEIRNSLISEVTKNENLDFKGNENNFRTELDTLIWTYYEFDFYKKKQDKTRETATAKVKGLLSMDNTGHFNEILELLEGNIDNLDFLLKFNSRFSFMPDTTLSEEFNNEMIRIFGLVDGMQQDIQALRSFPSTWLNESISETLSAYFDENVYVNFSTAKDNKTVNSKTNAGLRVGLGTIGYGFLDGQNRISPVMGSYFSSHVRYYIKQVDKTKDDPYGNDWRRRFSMNIGAMVGPGMYRGVELLETTSTIKPVITLGFDITQSLGIELGLTTFMFPRVVGVEASDNIFLIRPVFGITYDLNVLEQLKNN